MNYMPLRNQPTTPPLPVSNMNPSRNSTPVTNVNQSLAYDALLNRIPTSPASDDETVKIYQPTEHKNPKEVAINIVENINITSNPQPSENPEHPLIIKNMDSVSHWKPKLCKASIVFGALVNVGVLSLSLYQILKKHIQPEPIPDESTAIIDQNLSLIAIIGFSISSIIFVISLRGLCDYLSNK